ncbi:MAG: hypothetical protein JWN26_410 [Candidatus Saccharibacteria bacterium]|nr:hypothetical protein [Candidatus Saccharibacteria bacterium]
MWSDITNSIIAVATLSGAVIAGFGLFTWRKQLKGTYDYELAKKTLFSVYKLRDALRYVRQPFLSVGESNSDDKNIPWEQSAYINRWKEVREALILLDTNSLECEVVWGKGIPDARKSANSLIGQLNHALTMYIRSITDKKWEDDFQKFSDILYEKDENDEYNKKLTDEIKKFENILKPHLGRKD